MAKQRTGGGQRRKQLNPQAANDPIAAGAAATAGGPRSSADVAAEAKEHGDEVVQVHVPRTFRLTTDDRIETEYKAGAQLMPLEHFEHPYTKANGVTRVKKGE